MSVGATIPRLSIELRKPVQVKKAFGGILINEIFQVVTSQVRVLSDKPETVSNCDLTRSMRPKQLTPGTERLVTIGFET